MEANGHLGDLRESDLNSLLQGVGIGLNLPASEGLAVIGDGELETHGGSCRLGTRLRQGYEGKFAKLVFREEVLEKAMEFWTRVLLLVGIILLLPSCFVIKVPVETAGAVVLATTGVEVAGKAAGAVLEGKLPLPGKTGWRSHR